MSIEVTITGEIEEIENKLGVSIEQVVEGNGVKDVELSEKEELVLGAVEKQSGALRTVNKTVAEMDGSPFEYHADWDKDPREELQSILRRLINHGLVRLEENTYHPAGKG